MRAVAAAILLSTSGLESLAASAPKRIRLGDALGGASRQGLHAAGLSSGSPCGPARRELDAKLAGMAGVPSEVPAFFLHDSGAFDFAHAVACMLESIGADPGVDDLDLRLMPNHTEHLTDLRIFDLLRHHPSRTRDPKQARLHVVGAPLFASLVAAQAGGSACGGLSAHLRRAEGVAAALEDSPYFAECNGCNFIFVNSSPWHFQETFGPRLLALLRPRPVFLATADHQYHELNFYRDAPWQLLIIPYKAHFLAEASAVSRSDGAIRKLVRRFSRPGPEHRNVSFMFHGNLAGRHNEGEQRPILKELGRQLQHAAVPHLSIENVDFNDFRSPAAFGDASLRTAEALGRSSFCLVPAGDSPSSRRLYDALATGCVPIVLGSFADISENLPFGEAVPWADIAVFAGSLECVGEKTEEVSGWMRGLLAGHLRGAVARTRRLGQLEFRRALSYAGDGPAALLLREADAALTRRVPRARGWRGLPAGSPR